MKKISFKEKVNYGFDKMVAKGVFALAAFLGVLTIILVLITGITAYFLDKDWAGSIHRTIWKLFTMTLDAGSLFTVSEKNQMIIISAIVTLFGVIITSALIGIINSGISRKFENLRKSTSKVIESGHTVIVGFNDSIYKIITELIIANENQPKSCIVILGEADKMLMEESIESRVPDTKKTEIICRSGNPSLIADLEKCAINTCKAIIINEHMDSVVIKTILAISNILDDDNSVTATPFIVTSINESDNIGAAKIAGGKHIEVLSFNEAISRIMAHVCYQPGLSSVYTELFDFEGDEIYVEKFPQLTGYKFINALNCFEKSTVLGIKRGENLILNPKMDTLLDENDEIILIASDDHASKCNTPCLEPDKKGIVQAHKKCIAQIEKLLVVGYNELLLSVLTELDEYFINGASVKIAIKDDTDCDLSAIVGQFKNMNIDVEACNILSRPVLERLTNEGFKHILVLSDLRCPIQLADSKTLLILLNLRDISDDRGLSFSITSEMRDVKNQELAQCAEVSDFVVSSNIVSLMITQISENRDLAAIFRDLLDIEGSEIYMKPSSCYIMPGIRVNMKTVMYAVATHNEIFIGYKTYYKDQHGRQKMKIVTNPPKSSNIVFDENDWLIVLAENGEYT